MSDITAETVASLFLGNAIGLLLNVGLSPEQVIEKASLIAHDTARILADPKKREIAAQSLAAFGEACK